MVLKIIARLIWWPKYRTTFKRKGNLLLDNKFWGSGDTKCYGLSELQTGDLICCDCA